MKLSFYFDIHPWTKENDIIYAQTSLGNEKQSNAKRYRIDIEVEDPEQPDKIISGIAKEVIAHHPV